MPPVSAVRCRVSQSGSLVFYSLGKPQNTVELLHQTLIRSGARVVMWAVRSVGEDREWEAFRHSMIYPDQMPTTLEQNLVPREFAGRDIPSEAVSRLYQSGCSLRVTVGCCPLADEFARVVKNRLSQDIRGDFIPGELIVIAGAHDIYEASEHPEGLLIARSSFSVHLWGYGFPPDCELARTVLLGLPETVRVRLELEEVLGPLEQYAVWE
jgi:hypothetical protein